MIKKKGVARKRSKNGIYFAGEGVSKVQFVSSGNVMLDLALGGGWALGRVSNVVGDKSTGKTLIALEMMANALKTYPGCSIYYHEAEAAFDKAYAESLGLDTDKIIFPFDLADDFDGDGDTVEAFFDKVTEVAKTKTSQPKFYVLDSLDALSDKAEKERKITDGSYGTKAKKISEAFRRMVRDVHSSNMHLMVISQIRDKMDAVAFGRKWTRSGGRALDFYASQILEVAHKKRITQLKQRIERIVGVTVSMHVSKCKVGSPFHTVDAPIIFSYGMEELMSIANWLRVNNRTDALIELGLSVNALSLKDADKIQQEDATILDRARSIAIREWREVENVFMPSRRKY